MSFINDDFLLSGKTARRLYHEHAEQLPIIDYHCHLSPKEIADNKSFDDPYELFIGGDHYKWRQMRSCGVDEDHITGDAPNREKWDAWAKTLPLLIGNPLYHWTHLELKRYFDVDETLDESTAGAIWDKCRTLLSQDDFKSRALIEKSNVKVLCTTDDPADSLEYHDAIARSGFKTKVLPTFRPDKAINIDKGGFEEYIAATGVKNFEELCGWLVSRIGFFAERGCRVSDHGLEKIPYAEGDAAAVFEKKMNGGELTEREEDAYKTALMLVCAKEYVKRGTVMQIHYGAMRNNNAKMFAKLGPDSGFDSIGDHGSAKNMSRLLDILEVNGALPKTVIYPLDPTDYYMVGTMIGNFQSGCAGKLQLGSGWWFNDNRDGMEAQLRALGNLGALGTFVGMLTDSRSFVSYPRHEYFRRILCSLIGSWIDNGEYPGGDFAGKIVENISYYNAKNYFGF